MFDAQGNAPNLRELVGQITADVFRPDAQPQQFVGDRVKVKLDVCRDQNIVNDPVVRQNSVRL
jgi:hypothetical protein